MIKYPNYDINNENLLIDYDNIELIDIIENVKLKNNYNNVDFYDLEIEDNKNYQVSDLGLVHNGGKRAGAFTISIPIWHNDIEDFLEIQSENGDFRKKSFDIFPQIAIHDIFMKEVIKEDGGIWHTFCPHEVQKVLGITLPGLYGSEFNSAYKKCVSAAKKGKLKITNSYSAKDLLKNMMKTQFESGLPYITFIDLINEMNPNKHEGSIPCANLCTESFSNVEADKYAHTCNLLSVVVGRVDGLEEVQELSGLATRILDNGITLTKPPISESSEHNNRYRTIGIGIQGLHDYIAKFNISWTDLNNIKKLSEAIEYGAVLSSIELAKERGKYPAFENSMWNTGEMVEKFKKHSDDKEKWEQIQEEINKYGIRNSQLTSPAPNTSTSIFMDASAGIMPVYSAFYIEDNKTGKFPVYGMYLKENPLAYERTASRQEQTKLSAMVGALQQFVDTGISAEYIFDLNQEGISAKSLYDLIVSAWKNKTKAIYYIRSIKKGQTIDHVIDAETVCSGCAG